MGKITIVTIIQMKIHILSKITIKFTMVNYMTIFLIQVNRVFISLFEEKIHIRQFKLISIEINLKILCRFQT